MTQEQPPVRLCCMQRHWGVVCPDGKVMCQLCFDRFPISELHTTEDGEKEDICNSCAETEKNDAWRLSELW